MEGDRPAKRAKLADSPTASSEQVLVGTAQSLRLAQEELDAHGKPEEAQEGAVADVSVAHAGPPRSPRAQQRRGKQEGEESQTDPLLTAEASEAAEQEAGLKAASIAPATGASAGAAAADPFGALPAELFKRITGFLTSNEIALFLLRVNKATAAHFSLPQQRAIRLSVPVPHSEFVARWVGAGALRRLSRRQREQLPRLVAASGSIANLESMAVAPTTNDPVAPTANDPVKVLDAAVFTAAAGAGRVEVCAWLRQRRCIPDWNALCAAARGGHQAMCEWLLGGRPRSADARAASDAARGGHVGLMDWLLAAGPGSYTPHLVEGAAAGCDLATLQRLHHTYLDSVGEEPLDAQAGAGVLAAAAGSPTADWRAKVEWLEGRGYPRGKLACCSAASLPDGPARVEWLQQRGYPLSAGVAAAAAGAGHVQLVQHVLAAAECDAAFWAAAQSAAEAGRVDVLQALLQSPEFSNVVIPRSAAAAAEHGHLPVLEALVEAQGAARVLTECVFAAAAKSGSMELLAWLHARGCPWDASVFVAAAEWGSEEQLEWLAAQGCPMGSDGKAYVRALAHGHLPVLRCLKRLGCPWGTRSAAWWEGAVQQAAEPLLEAWLEQERPRHE